MASSIAITKENVMSPMTIRACGALVATGGITWGIVQIASPSTPEQNSQAEMWGSGVFQLGLLALFAVMWATYATGTHWGRTALAAETVAVILATAWTVPHLIDANRPSTGLLAVLDLFWPLSMIGLIVVGVFVITARQWSRALRYLPLAGGLLIPAWIAVSWAPEQAQNLVISLYLVTIYSVLGLMLIRNANRLTALAATGANNLVISGKPA
jgi:hypothetical protein